MKGGVSPPYLYKAETMEEEITKLAKEEAQLLSLSIINDGTIAKKVSEKIAKYIAENYPERVRTAYWVTVDSTKIKDRGLEVTILKKSEVGRFKNLRLSAMIGRETYGGGIFADVWSGAINNVGLVASVGIGGVKPYSGGDWSPFIGISIKF